MGGPEGAQGTAQGRAPDRAPRARPGVRRLPALSARGRFPLHRLEHLFPPRSAGGQALHLRGGHDAPPRGRLQREHGFRGTLQVRLREEAGRRPGVHRSSPPGSGGGHDLRGCAPRGAAGSRRPPAAHHPAGLSLRSALRGNHALRCFPARAGRERSRGPARGGGSATSPSSGGWRRGSTPSGTGVTTWWRCRCSPKRR